jgi:hypothetical protein
MKNFGLAAQYIIFNYYEEASVPAAMMVKLASIGFVLSLLLLLCCRSLLREVCWLSTRVPLTSQYLFHKTRFHDRRNRFRSQVAGRASPTLNANRLKKALSKHAVCMYSSMHVHKMFSY